jgi:integrase/recombinase XerD
MSPSPSNRSEDTGPHSDQISGDQSGDHDRQRDIRRVAKILRDGGYTYDQSKHLIAEARKAVGLSPPKRESGSVDRLTAEEMGELLEAAYAKSARQGLMLRTLLETGMRVSAFARLRAEDISFQEREIRVRGKGDKKRDVPVLQSLLNELRLHLDGRRTGYLFPSPRGGHYSARRIQQIVKARAEDAGITKSVYPHLLRHTIAQRLADAGMPENLLQRFLGHAHPSTTQVYYEPSRPQVKRAFEEAME